MSTPRLDTLPAIEEAVWRELGLAVRTKGHGWRLGVLATVDEGGAPDARNVVLRDLDTPARTLLIYTDARSPKAQQLQARPLGKLVLWSEALGWQLRLSVSLALQTTGLQVSSRWAQLKLTPAAQDYLSPLPPGSTLGEAHAAAPAAAHAAAPARASRDHFAVITARVDLMDWLELHPQGHRRARLAGAASVWLTA